jgi:hypothetical protein
MLDSDLARLYGVTTAALNQTVNETQIGFPGILRFSLHSRRLRI